MPTAYTEGYTCPWCDRPYLALSLSGAIRPPHPGCPALPTHLALPPAHLPDPGLEAWDYKSEGLCVDCKQGEHEACMRWLCTCPSSVHFATNSADRIRY